METYQRVLLVHLRSRHSVPKSTTRDEAYADLILHSYRTTLKSGLVVVRTMSVKDRYHVPGRYFLKEDIAEI
jgi:hypothetical protein